MKLCKFNRLAIESSLGAIYSIVATPKFICRSCARVAGSSINLCKPSAIPPQACRDKITHPTADLPTNELEEQCALLIEAKATNSLIGDDSSENPSSPAVLSLDVVSSDDGSNQPQQAQSTSEVEASALISFNEKQLKKQRKLLKKQKKMYKKLCKILHKEEKLAEKRRKLDVDLCEMLEAKAKTLPTSSHLH